MKLRRFIAEAPGRHLCALVGLLLAGQPLMAANDQFMVAGSLTSQNGLAFHSASTPAAYDFTVVVVADKWHIKIVLRPVLPTQDGATAPQPGCDYEEASSDGTNVFYVASFDSIKNARPDSINAGVAHRGSGAVPYNMRNELICLWYVYASHHYLEGRVGLKIHPLQNRSPEDYQHGDYLQPAEWRLASEPPRLPWFIATKCAGLDVPAPNRESLPLVATNALLQVVAATNLGGLLLPSQARISLYVHPELSKPVLFRCVEINGKTFSTRVVPVTFVPVLPQPSVIFESRFWTSSPPATVSL